ncbi:G2/mitotic-specific cyclin-B3-like [Uloborus diversus]|uniref:G2/mitotic-specific cyclin-B3-like n=1 Tax=Uloborus diversus TaxID=327109 RepID=UPI002409C998|nr:G2/mitotic-specific cyclin-B3-like [Uloborus diversus]
MESKTLNRIITRSQVIEDSDDKPAGKDASKRLADPLPDLGSKKRILGDITNQVKLANTKTNAVSKRTAKHGSYCSENALPDSNLSKNSSSNKSKDKESCSSDDTIYVTALEQCESDSGFESRVDTTIEEPLPDGVEDYDKWAQHDPYNESRYAADIFKYYREREKKFTVEKYLQKQSEITKGMRAILVDWMVEVQESFELNHETLYLAVKLVDRYLMRHFVPKALLQLLGATTLFVAAKFDKIKELKDSIVELESSTDTETDSNLSSTAEDITDEQNEEDTDEDVSDTSSDDDEYLSDESDENLFFV